MLNKELYGKEIIELAIANEEIAVTSVGVCACNSIECHNCDFYYYDCYKQNSCDEARIKWANQEALIEPELTEVQKLYNNLSDTMKGSILDIMKEAQPSAKKEQK